jgi:thioredoxin-like negative regulator of GroEL
MFAHAQTAMKVSQDAYHDALAELAPLYREKHDYALMLVDYYLFNEDYDKAQQALDMVAESIGQDAGLDSLHAGIALQDHAYQRAIAYARDGIQRDATYEDNYWVLLDALVYSRNYADAVLVLNILEQGFDYRFDTRQMATLEGYEEFSRSDAFNSWRTASAH